MAISRTIDTLPIGDLFLDPLNPRLGRGNTGPDVKQSRILELMQDWSLEELGTSFVENGYWPQEALLVTKERLYGRNVWVVVEGNRRLATLKFLFDAASEQPSERTWRELAAGLSPDDDLFQSIPIIKIGERSDVDTFLGFRHVTGIKEWRPAEKAQFIAHLIEDREMTYEEVRRRIGSRAPTVRQNYISYRLLIQMEGDEDISLESVERKFSVLYLALRTEGARSYLSIDIQADPDDAYRPVPRAHLRNLRNFALWLFGDEKKKPFVRESRDVDAFGKILESKKAVEYLERSDRPNWDMAWQIAGGDEPELLSLIEEATDNIALSLSRIHRYPDSKKLRKAVANFLTDVDQLISVFPDLRSIICAEDK